MKSQNNISKSENSTISTNRRSFITKGGFLVAAGLVVPGLLSSCSQPGESSKTDGGAQKGAAAAHLQGITANEYLMLEHGVLKRLLTIYDEAANRLNAGTDIDLDLINKAATTVKEFIEDYHEKLEEDHLFPKFEKADELKDLVKVLRVQHDKGRTLTQKIIAGSKSSNPSASEKNVLASDLKLYSRMFCAHSAREDTVLFPAFSNLLSEDEYLALSAKFKDIEKRQFGGDDGFAKAVSKVARIEKSLNIYDLSVFNT